MKAKASQTRRFPWPLAFVLSLLIAATLIGLIFWRIETWPARTMRDSSAELERLARNARDAFVEIAQVQPRITVNDRIYFEKTSAVAELAILERRMEVEHEFEHVWLGSTKRVRLHGTFKAKAGFDLRQDFVVEVRDSDIAVQLPHATILGVEQEQVDVLEFENGYWNRISAGDLQSELASLQKIAREKAKESGLTSEAEHALQKQIEERLGNARPLRLLFGSKATEQPKP